MYDYNDEDSFDSEEDSGLLKKAFDVTLPVNFNPKSIPKDGNEYLHHVIYERNRCKQCVTVPIDPKKVKKVDPFDIPLKSIDYNIPLHLLPSVEWQNKKLSEFKYFKGKLDEIYERLNIKPTISSFNEDKFLTNLVETCPQYSSFLKYTQQAKLRMLELITDFISDNELFNELIGVWIFAILATLNVPMTSTTCFILRDFIRTCQYIRSKLSENEEKSWNALNFFICICCRYYHQLDLADFSEYN